MTGDSDNINGSAVLGARVDADLSQEQLARRANVSLRTVQRAEDSDPQITYRSARKLATALGVPVDAIFPTDDAPRAWSSVAPAPENPDEAPPQWAVDLDRKVSALIAFHHSGGNTDYLEGV